MDDMLDDQMGLEKMNYTRFTSGYVVRRATQAPGKFDQWEHFTLPTGSVLHTLNGFDTLTPENGGLPDANLPPVFNEKLPVFLKIHARMADADSVPFGVKDNFTYRPNTLSAGIIHFYQTHRHYHRIISDRTLGTMGGVLTWVDYSPLNEASVSGTLSSYRKFDILFRSVLDMVVQIGAGKHHYIHLVQGNHVYSRALMLRAFRELSTSTLGSFTHDPSIYPILHILGYIYGKTHDIPVTPYKEDVKILGKEDPIYEGLKSTSLFERIPEGMLESINFVLQRGDRAVVYNLADIVKFAEDPSFYTKFYRHVMNLRMTEATIPSHVDVDSDQFDTLVAHVSGDHATTAVTEEDPPKDVVRQDEETTIPVTRTVSTKALEPTHAHVDIPISITPTHPTFEGRLRHAVIEQSAAAVREEPKRESRRNLLIEQHLKASIGGKTIGELIQNPPEQTIAPKSMSFLVTTPELSYQKSSLLSMDKAYQDHAYHHELAKVVGSLAKHGMFVTKVEEEKIHTEMDRMTTFKLNLSDLVGKTHHIKFTLPDVDDNGLMKLSGTEYRLNRQIANVPICKISPTRVNMSSYYNKIIVERIQSKRFSYEQDMGKFILDLKMTGLLQATVGSAPYPTKKVSYDYTAIGRNFTDIVIGNYHFQFGGNHAPLENLDPEILSALPLLEKTYGIYVGHGPNKSLLFWDNANRIHQIGLTRKDFPKPHNTEVKSAVDALEYEPGHDLIMNWASFTQFLVQQLGRGAMMGRTPIEWTQAHILNQTIPIIFILAYKQGMKAVLDRIHLVYQFHPTGTRFEIGVDDIEVRFSDGTLVFNRYPLSRSLVAAGLKWVDLKDVSFRDLSTPDTYAKVFAKKAMSVGVLKGLNGFFDFFIDPITETVLEKMKEPTTFPELLLRSSVMLTDYHADESSSIKLHRFRLYERFNGMVYNEIFRDLAQHRNNPASKKSFSINPEAVFQKIVQDATVSPNDVINPVHEVKQRASYTFTGSGGRTPNSFVLKDRIYPKDGLGVVSDAVPDSGKVGITSYLTSSPNIDDIHGIPKPYKDGDELSPPQVLSIGSMVLPGGTTDDGKRNSYLSIQISHYVPNHYDGETLAMRTGYDQVLPHLSSDVFAQAAEEDGVVDAIDDKNHVVQVKYIDKPMDVLRPLKLPYLDGVLDQYRVSQTSFGYLIPESDIAHYPMGAVFSLTRNTNGKIVDRLRCETVDAIPDKDISRKQNQLVLDFVRGKYKALYYLRFVPISTRTPGVTKHYSFADIHSPISGAYLLQKRTPNVVPGEKFKQGDILIYNSGFFVPDPLTKQVSFKHGVIATVALVEKSSNHEDACEISRDLADRLLMTPAHQREVITRPDAAILQMVKVGDHVETSDSLCIISDEYLISSSGKINIENLDLMEKLNRQTPGAGYTGVVRKIGILYGCDREKLSESLKTILKTYEREVRQNFVALNSNPSLKPPERPGFVPAGTKYKGIDFDANTVVLEFMIEETLGMAFGDKLVVANANKSIVSHVNDKPHYSESGIPVDMLFSTTSIINRIVSSPLTIGMTERNLMELKKQTLAMYFDE